MKNVRGVPQDVLDLKKQAFGLIKPALLKMVHRPFVFTIVHRDTNAILFVGRMNEPTP